MTEDAAETFETLIDEDEHLKYDLKGIKSFIKKTKIVGINEKFKIIEVQIPESEIKFFDDYHKGDFKTERENVLCECYFLAAGWTFAPFRNYSTLLFWLYGDVSEVNYWKSKRFQSELNIKHLEETK
jgi:hypothetical protein